MKFVYLPKMTEQERDTMIFRLVILERELQSTKNLGNKANLESSIEITKKILENDKNSKQTVFVLAE